MTHSVQVLWTPQETFAEVAEADSRFCEPT